PLSAEYAAAVRSTAKSAFESLRRRIGRPRDRESTFPDKSAGAERPTARKETRRYAQPPNAQPPIPPQSAPNSAGAAMRRLKVDRAFVYVRNPAEGVLHVCDH